MDDVDVDDDDGVDDVEEEEVVEEEDDDDDDDDGDATRPTTDSMASSHLYLGPPFLSSLITNGLNILDVTNVASCPSAHLKQMTLDNPLRVSFSGSIGKSVVMSKSIAALI